MKQIILFLLVSLLLVSPVLAYSVPDDTIVYVTPSGTKYHRKDCTYTTATSSLTLQEAESRGYGPCSRCNPDIFHGEYIPPETSHSSSGSSFNNSDPSDIVENPVCPDQFGSTSPASSSVSLDVSSEPTSSDELPVLTVLFIRLVYFVFLVLLSVAILLILVCSFQWLNDRKFKSRLKHSQPPPDCLTVYYTRYGKSFHISDCPRIKRNSKIYPIPIIYVNRLKLSPCPFCNPTTQNISLPVPFEHPSSSHPSPGSASQPPLTVLPPHSPAVIPDPVASKSPLMVYFSLQSKTFHLENCGCLSRSKHVVSATITYAFNHQMAPCKICRPMDLVTSYEYVRWQDVLDQSSVQTPDDPVYFPLSGSFYHEKSCPTLQHQANIVSADLRTAVMRNKRQCPVCKPVRRVPIKYSLSAPID